MNKEQALKTAGLAAVIMLAPGGFLLGAALLARKLRRTPEPEAPSETV